MKRHWLAALLAAVCTLTGTQTAWAQTTYQVTRTARSNTEFTFTMPTNNVETTVEYVDAKASITPAGENPTILYYEKLADALADAAAAGDVIKLLADETITTGLTINNSITLDLNGHTLTYTGTENALTVSSGKTVIIQDTGTGENPGGITSPSGTAIYNESNASLTVNGGTISGRGGITSLGELTVTGGSFRATGGDTWSAISIQNGTFNLSDNPTLTTPNGASAIYLISGMVINIPAALTAPMTPWTVKSYNINNAATTPYTFTSGFSTYCLDGSNVANPADYFACTTAGVATHLNRGGEAQFVIPNVTITTVGDNPTTLYYPTLAAALADASSTTVETITLLADEDLGTTGVTINQNVTLDLNGHTLTCSSIENALTVSSGKTVIITGATGETPGGISHTGVSGSCINNVGMLTVSRGTITSTSGIAIYNNGGTLAVNGGTISGASGIFNLSGELSVTGGSITATENGSHAIIIPDGTFNLSGNPSLSATATGSAIYLVENMVININGALTAPTTAWKVGSYNIDYAPTTPYTFTNGFSTYCLTPTDAVANPADYFACTTANITTRLNSSEAQFAPYPVLTLAAGPTTGGTVELADITGTANEPILPDGVTDNGNGTYTVVPGTNVTVKATAVVVDNYHFDKWTDENDVPYTGTGYTIGYSDYSITSPSDMFPAKSTITFNMGTDDMTMKGNFEKFSVTVPAGKSVTYFTDIKFKVTDASAELYTISSVSGSEAVLSDAITVAPANTPLLIHNSSNENKTFDIIPTMEDATSVTVASQFKGTATAKTTADTDTYGPWHWATNTKYYGFNGTNFVWIKEAGDVAAHRCWLETGTNSAPILTIDWDGNATGIKTTNRTNDTNDAWYDLNGRKLQSKPTKKGVYILNGKKMVVK